MKAKSVTRQKILKEIEGHLTQSKQWAERIDVSYYSSSLFYLCKAESLIELLEVEDCGSIGGFGTKTVKGKLISQNENKNYPSTLEGRFKWLKEMT